MHGILALPIYRIFLEVGIDFLVLLCWRGGICRCFVGKLSCFSVIQRNIFALLRRNRCRGDRLLFVGIFRGRKFINGVELLYMQKPVLNSIFSLEIVSSWYFLLLIINVKKVFGQKTRRKLSRKKLFHFYQVSRNILLCQSIERV